MHLDVLVHLENAEHLGQPADAVVLEVEREVAAHADGVGRDPHACRDVHVAGHAVDAQAAAQGHRAAVPRRRARHDIRQVEAHRGKRVDLHRLAEVRVAFPVAGAQRRHHALHPATDGGEVGTSGHLPADRVSRAHEIAERRVAVEAQGAARQARRGDRGLGESRRGPEQHGNAEPT